MNEANTNKFFQLIYTSQPAPQLTEQSLIDILIDAQQYNKNEGISGFLLSSPEKLIQLIEGDALEVESLYQKIRKDSRHDDIAIQHFGFADKRCMPFLGMGLCFMDGGNRHDHQFYFTQDEARKFSALIAGNIGEIFGKYLSE
jgi:hypothetical protein